MTEVLKLVESITGLLQTGQALIECKCQNGHHVVHFHNISLHSYLCPNQIQLIASPHLTGIHAHTVTISTATRCEIDSC